MALHMFEGLTSQLHGETGSIQGGGEGETQTRVGGNVHGGIPEIRKPRASSSEGVG